MSHAAKLKKYDIHANGVYACSTWARNRQAALAAFRKAGCKWAGSQWLANRIADTVPGNPTLTVSLAS